MRLTLSLIPRTIASASTAISSCCYAAEPSLKPSGKKEQRESQSKDPVLTVGGLGDVLETDRVLDYSDQEDEERKLCVWHRGLMDRRGHKIQRCGDADTRLAVF
jgi:hypothetical protein